MAQKKRRQIGDPKLLYKACKLWAEEEAKSVPAPTLAEIWNRAVEQDENGARFRRYVLRSYKLFLEFGY